jgi:DNA-directed RNA polymerase subunit alpha
MLLSSLHGTAVWAFRLDGVVHEHQTIPNVVEDVHQIIQRLKTLTLVLAEDTDNAVLHLSVDKAGQVRAGDLQPQGSVEITNPDHLLFTLQEDRELSGELFVNKGRGYVESSQHVVERSLPVDLVRIDAVYNPVRRANFTVAETRVGPRTDYDRLSLVVETNGTLTPEDAVSYAAALLHEHVRHFFHFGGTPEIAGDAGGDRDPADAALKEKLAQPIDAFGLSVRSVNSLKNSSIHTLGDLVRHSRDDMLKVKNVGEKALGEIDDLLVKQGLSFGMSLDFDPQLIESGGISPSGGS